MAEAAPHNAEIKVETADNGNKRKRQEIIIDDDPQPKRMSTYPLLPKNYVEDEAKRLSRQKYRLEVLAIPGAIEARAEENKRILLYMYQSGALSTTWYDRLAILQDGDIGHLNGEPLVPRSPAGPGTFPSAQGPNQESRHPQGLTRYQWIDICTALDRLPSTWHVCWGNTFHTLRRNYDAGERISLKMFQSKMRSAKEKHLLTLERYLELIQPWKEKRRPSVWTNFTELSKDLQSWLFTLFGVQYLVPNSRPPSVRRTWGPDHSRRDRGVKEDVCRLQGGMVAAAALESLMYGNDTTISGKDRRTARCAMDGFRGLLHHLEKSGTIVTKVEGVFGDFWVSLGDMSFPETETRIQELYEAVKKDMTG